MALNKVEQAQLGKFGKLTTSSHIKNDKSIFGQNACSTVCSYTDSFNDITVGDNGAFDIFSQKGMHNVEEQMKIMQCQDKNPEPKHFEMDAKSFMVLKEELGLGQRKRVFNS